MCYVSSSYHGTSYPPIFCRENVVSIRRPPRDYLCQCHSIYNFIDSLYSYGGEVMILESRKCQCSKCKVIFRVNVGSKQMYCSEFCKLQDNPQLHPLNRNTKDKAKYSMFLRWR